ncbi:MAG: DegT/DnrJ/EryC1/StrS family aminotransferase [Psychrilyobacter sp.]|uniref:DegT/DnrJ/EryC1/StrS family aminotransferase n=1 Tax=Psychrilyobacter sp. TaxID=2586924 RepID=UPI003C788E36
MDRKIIFKNRASSVIFEFIRSIKKKGVLLLPANICPIVPLTFMKAKIEFEFIDIELDTFCCDFKEVEEKIRKNKNIIGLLFVNAYGIEKDFSNNFKKLRDLNKELIIIHDKCLSYPDFSHQDSLADLTVYSTGQAKVVNIGYGGFGILHNTNFELKNIDFSYNEQDYIKIYKAYKKTLITNKKFNYIENEWLDLREPLLNFSEYQKIVSEKINEIKLKKNQLNDLYEKGIDKKFKTFYPQNNWRYIILLDNSDAVIKKIFEQKLFASQHYKSLVDLFGNGNGKNAKKLEKEVINLFNDFCFDELKVRKIIKLINEHGRKK